LDRYYVNVISIPRHDIDILPWNIEEAEAIKEARETEERPREKQTLSLITHKMTRLEA
jgi:hypothetical protein